MRGTEKGFNSTLVRLKVIAEVATQLLTHGFQFHTGSIKSQDLNIGGLTHIEFQFHTGSIKRDEGTYVCIVLNKFQFHTGSIKSFYLLNNVNQ